MSFSENDCGGRRVDYEAVVSRNLRLVPSGAAQQALAKDHASMLAHRDVLDEDERCEIVIRRYAMIEERANAALLAARG